MRTLTRAAACVICTLVLPLLVEGKECAPGCVARGNCNADEGTCQCKFGWTGPTCEVPILPACQQNASDTGVPLLGRAFPKNCECYKQSYKLFNCGHGRAMMQTCEFNSYKAVDTPCYTYLGVAPKDQHSLLPRRPRGNTAPAANLTCKWHMFMGYDKPLRDLPHEREWVYENAWRDRYRALPLRACPGSCSHAGVCVKSLEDNRTAPHCLCNHGHYSSHEDGPGTCDQVDMTLCPNECLGRGQCISGFCHCKPPYWGHDCGRKVAVIANPQAIPPRTRLAIYVYELPHALFGSIAMDDGFSDRLSAHMAHEHFTSLLLSDAITRTLDPYAANLFYVPAPTYSYASNTGDPSPYLNKVLRYVASTWPWFNRTGGKDHIVWAPGDRGACYARDSFQDVIKLVHFGYHVNSEARPNVSSLEPTPEDKYQGCYNPLRDVVAPPFFERNEGNATELYTQMVANQGVAASRDLLFVFAGSVRAHQPSYSGGARQAVHTLLSHMNTTGGDLNDIQFTIGRVSDYFDLHMRSKFCLCPHGAGFGMRLAISMQYACIPVIISDLVFQPLEDVLPYQEFTIRIPNHQLPELVDILRSITLQDQAVLRLGMARWYKAFIWNPAQHGAAYSYTLQALHKRLIHFWGNLY